MSFIRILCIALVLKTSTVSAFEIKKLNQSKQLENAITKRKTGDYSQAIEILSHLRALHIDHKRINLELALNYIKVQQYDNAEEILQHLRALSLTKKEQKTVDKIKHLLEVKLRKSLTPHSFIFDVGISVGVDIVSNSYPVFVYDDFQNETEYWL